MKNIKIDQNYILNTLEKLSNIYSPTGFTDEVVRFVAGELGKLGVDYQLTRRGAIQGTIKGKTDKSARATVTHLDTLGAMVRELKSNGRLAITKIGYWSPRFAEGARVTIFTDHASYRGTILPLKASGHTYGDEIDNQPVSWDNLEIRVDEKVANREDLQKLGFNIGDFVAVDEDFELSESGFINMRHLDDKAAVAAQLAALKALKESGAELEVDYHPLFTITEEEGSGASAVLHGNIASMVAVDNSTIAPGQESSEYGVTIAMRDRGNIYDYHLTHKLIKLCEENKIDYTRDVFRFYRSDAAAAIEAGNDIRTALICFALDASHGYERTHIDSLIEVARLIASYALSDLEIERDKYELGPLEGFQSQTNEITNG